jgi:AAA+ superfamily predicted ATPase
MMDRIKWTPWSTELARRSFARLVGATRPAQLARFRIEGRIAKLPFYRHWRLVVISSAYGDPGQEAALEDVYALWREGLEAILLDGTSTPVHTVNEDESLHLVGRHGADYIRFFCFAVRGEGGEPFYLYELPPEEVEDDPDAVRVAKPLRAKGTDADGKLLFETAMVFSGEGVHVLFGLPPGGQLEMVDDDPLGISLPPTDLPRLPVLGFGPMLSQALAETLPQAARTRVGRRIGGRGRAPSTARGTPPRAAGKSAVVQMVELLLERALQDRPQNRLIGYFNATLPAAQPLDQFAALVADATPVVVVETSMPFVEETIAEIVNERLPAGRRIPVHGPSAAADNLPLEFLLPALGPALVIIPLQVYRSVARVERVAYDIAARDLAAIIACERLEQLPESLRRIKDVLLRLPVPDAAAFEALFLSILGHLPPAGWDAGGSEWVRHLLPTDFEHPRRMKLARSKALAYIRDQVTERLGAVDPARGLGLTDLHGLGEARQFAEDFIADIHAARNGELPWSQVDRGALLVGAPGTGKTTLAMAIAKGCGVRFIQASAAGWQAEGESLGPHIQAIRRTFSEARRYAPSILFIDEIDSLGNRTAFAGTQNAVYQTEVVNAVLEEMVALDPAAPVFFIGATNHEAGVDPALLRSGRLDRVIRIPRPNSAALHHIYRYYLGALGKGVAVDRRLDPSALAGLSVGLTGADVERIVRGAARRARKAGRALSQADVLDEITNKPRGFENVLVLTRADLERTAIHEAGHALALFLGQSKGTDIGFVTIVPRDDGTLGFVAPLPDERVHLTRHDYEARIGVCLAGRAAEALRYGEDEVSGGADSDLQSATEMATRMVTRLGLTGTGRLAWSEAASPADLAAAETILARAYERVRDDLRQQRPRLEKLAKSLLLRQELTGDEVRRILGRR